MRLHSLNLQAFGPFATPQRVDFDRLAGSGLFLLEGPTGAGKTTVLDAITFALYGGLAGEDAADDRLHSHFAMPGLEPSVTLEFSLRGTRYRIGRVPEHRRPKRRGQGYTTEAMRVHLERRDGGRWQSLSSNKAETGDLIDEIVGLNRTQFTQVMLLPQGEFARFLRSDDDARRLVLTKLFGTELYDKITTELDRRRADAVRGRLAADAEIGAATSAAAEAAGLDAAARGELIGMAPEPRATALGRLSDDLAEALARSSEALERSAADEQAAQAAEQQAARDAALMTRLTGALRALHEHEATRSAHDRRSASLDAARRAEPVRPLLAMLTDAEAAADRERAALRTLLGSDMDEELACLLGADADGNLICRTSKQAADLAEAALRDAAGLDRLVVAESALPDREAAVGELGKAGADAAAMVASLTAVREELPDKIAAAEAALAEAREVAAGLAADQQRQAELTRLGAAAARLAEIEPLRAAAAARLQAAVQEHQRQVDAHQQAMDARLAGLAAELAAGLSDGSPCPVCGAAEHPAPASASAQPVTPGAVAAARRRRDEAEAARLEAATAHADLDRESAEQAAIAGGHSAASLAAQVAEVAARLTSARRAATRAPQLAAEVTRLRDQQEQLGDRLRACVAAETAARKEFERADADLAALRKELAQEAGGHESVAARQGALRAAADDNRVLAAALDRLAAGLGAEGSARDLATDEAHASGFDCLDAARSAVMAPEQQSALNETVAGWGQTLVALQAATADAELAGLDPERAGDVAAAAQRAAASLAEARQAGQVARAVHDGQRTRASRLECRLAEVQAAEQAAASLVAATEPVIYLAGLAKGMEGHRRVALTTYVLRHWFEQVVAAANVRLAVMSAGRYELRRSDESDSRRQRAGLTLTMIDRHTGEERSPKSLSGGETFYTSLALALGLADVVKSEAGGVDTETLFIDEGFGSLDAETLDQVLGVIDELRDHGRAIGIVSHVADLKDRIAERLEVHRLPDGSSALRVVA